MLVREESQRSEELLESRVSAALIAEQLCQITTPPENINVNFMFKHEFIDTLNVAGEMASNAALVGANSVIGPG